MSQDKGRESLLDELTRKVAPKKTHISKEDAEGLEKNQHMQKELANFLKAKLAKRRLVTQSSFTTMSGRELKQLALEAERKNEAKNRLNEQKKQARLRKVQEASEQVKKLKESGEYGKPGRVNTPIRKKRDLLENQLKFRANPSTSPEGKQKKKNQKREPKSENFLKRKALLEQVFQPSKQQTSNKEHGTRGSGYQSPAKRHKQKTPEQTNAHKPTKFVTPPPPPPPPSNNNRDNAKILADNQRLRALVETQKAQLYEKDQQLLVRDQHGDQDTAKELKSLKRKYRKLEKEKTRLENANKRGEKAYIELRKKTKTMISKEKVVNFKNSLNIQYKKLQTAYQDLNIRNNVTEKKCAQLHQENENLTKEIEHFQQTGNRFSLYVEKIKNLQEEGSEIAKTFGMKKNGTTSILTSHSFYKDNSQKNGFDQEESLGKQLDK